MSSIVSFGYKHGLPLDVDLVFDCRFLPNPHWVDELRPLAGRDVRVRDYVLGRTGTDAYLEQLDTLFALLLPRLREREGKAYLSIGIGCTGGRHRSVVISAEIAKLLERQGFSPTVHHRDLDRDLTGGPESSRWAEVTACRWRCAPFANTRTRSPRW